MDQDQSLYRGSAMAGTPWMEFGWWPNPSLGSAKGFTPFWVPLIITYWWSPLIYDFFII